MDIEVEDEEHQGRGGRYRVLVTRYRDWWHIEVPTLDVHAQSRLLRETERGPHADTHDNQVRLELLV